MTAKLERASELEDELRRTIVGYEKKRGKVWPNEKSSPARSKPKSDRLSLSQTMEQVKKGRPLSTIRREVRAERRGRMKHVRYYTMVLVVLLGAIIAGASFSDFFSANGLCAPVVPGTIVWAGRDLTASSPWWLPDDWKAEGFAFFCQGRKRIQVRVESGKLNLDEHSKNGHVKTLQRIDLVRAIFHASNLVIKGRKGTQTIIPAPWGG